MYMYIEILMNFKYDMYVKYLKCISVIINNYIRMYMYMYVYCVYMYVHVYICTLCIHVHVQYVHVYDEFL